MKYPTLMLLAMTVMATGLGAPAWAQDPAQSPSNDPSMTGAPPATTPSDSSGTGTGSAMPSTTDTTGSTTSDDQATTGDSLPATATPLWLLGMLGGAGVMGVAATLRGLRLRRRRA